MAAIPDNGRLEETPLPRLLVELYHANFQGRLELGRRRVEHAFLLTSGAAVGCESPAAKNGLCDQLVDTGSIAPADRDRVISLIESKGCQEASALLELGLLDARGLVFALRDQVRTRLLECIGWTSGAFGLDAGAPPPDDTHPLRVDVYAVVQAGIAAHWRADRVLQDLEPKIARIASKSERFAAVHERLESDDALAAFVQTLDGSASLWDALKLATTPRSLAAAWVLDAAGALHYSATPEAADAQAPCEIEIVFADETESAPQRPAASERPPQADAKPGASKVAAALRSEIASRFENLGNLDYYQLLGVEAKAAIGAIKASYLQAAKRYHPDALAKAGLDAEARRQANDVFAKISKAYSVLSNPRRRAEYDEAQRSEEAPFDAARLANAESLFRKGEVLLRSGNFAGALEFLRPAVELWPEEAEYGSALGWALYRKLPSEPVPAREQLERAVEQAPENARAIHRLSIVVRSLGEVEEADALLERARSIDPKIG